MKLKIRTKEGVTYDLVETDKGVPGLYFVPSGGSTPVYPREIAELLFPKFIPPPDNCYDVWPGLVLKRCQESDYFEILETDIEPDEEVPADAVF